MFRKISLIVAFVAMAFSLVASPAMAAVTLNDDGTGFVGKGDVQAVYDWSDKNLQDNFSLVEFRVNSETVTEVSWTCTNSNNENEQQRERTTTTTTRGLVDSIARNNERANKITGFTLSGYIGDPSVTTETDGNPLNSCPSGPWTLTTPAGDPVPVDGSGGGVEVSIDGVNWYPIG